MFLHLSVILFIGGVPGQLPPRQVRPRQVHMPGRYTCQAGTPLGKYTHPRAGTPSRYTPRQILRDAVNERAGGTHPTGIHSCSLNNAVTLVKCCKELFQIL